MVQTRHLVEPKQDQWWCAWGMALGYALACLPVRQLICTSFDEAKLQLSDGSRWLTDAGCWLVT